MDDEEDDGDAEWMQMLDGVEQAAEEKAVPDEDVGEEADEEGGVLAAIEAEQDGVLEALEADVGEGEAEAEEEVVEEPVEESVAEEVQEPVDVMAGAAEENDNSEVLDAALVEGEALDAEGGTEVVAQSFTGFIEIEDDGGEEDYDYYGEEQEEEAQEAQETEQVDDAELADLEKEALAQAEGTAGDSQAGAEFRDALDELPEGTPVKPTVHEQVTKPIRTQKPLAGQTVPPVGGGAPRKVLPPVANGAPRTVLPPGPRPPGRHMRPGKGGVVAKGPRMVLPPGGSVRPMLRPGPAKGNMRGVAPWRPPVGQVRGKAFGAKGSVFVRPAMKGGKHIGKGSVKGKVAMSGKAAAPWNSNIGDVHSSRAAALERKPSHQAASISRQQSEDSTKSVAKEKVADSGTANAPWNSTAKKTQGGRPPAAAITTSSGETSAATRGGRPPATSNGATAAVAKSKKKDGSGADVASKPLSIAEKIKNSIKKSVKGESDKTESKVKKSSPEGVGAAGKRKGGDASGVSRGSWQNAQSSTAYPGPAKKKSKTEQVAAVDAEGRRYDLEHVVVNFANVGAYYAIKVMNNMDDGKFDWEGVRRCLRHLTKEVGLKAIGVIYEQFSAPDNGSRQKRKMPDDIRNMCEAIQETPRIQGQNHSSADDEMTIKCAYRRNCRFMDNDNYRDWKTQLRDDKCRHWLTTNQNMLQMRYYFDTSLGTFDTLDGNIPPGMLAPVKGKQPAKIDKRDLW